MISPIMDAVIDLVATTVVFTTAARAGVIAASTTGEARLLASSSTRPIPARSSAAIALPAVVLSRSGPPSPLSRSATAAGGRTARRTSPIDTITRTWTKNLICKVTLVHKLVHGQQPQS